MAETLDTVEDIAQYRLFNGELVMTVKKSPLFVRAVLFVLAFLFFLIPLSGMIVGASSGNGLHLGYLIGIAVFGLMGFYLLRMVLWNTYGKEIIQIGPEKIDYIADYGWFKRNQKSIAGPPEFSSNRIGYEEDKTSGLLIIGPEGAITCVTKLSDEQVEQLIDELQSMVET